ncbi:Mor transcription activator family protein [Shewanella algae]|uniref:Mor transcription activator family protein n=1 Tax=Shewanella algae TaxID=38313 RepID=UPI000D128D08|nr:Mor transcription activator family protein [Shewanella algae]PSS68756.1 transcriptional regulator [Shewanella algae]TVL05257.1 transcriptional regulator [Shewanella algae]TVL53279.1 transcriptional regulator [Shewanella algae]
MTEECKGKALQHDSEEQLELLGSDSQELEQALLTHASLYEDERSEFMRRCPTNLQSLCELNRTALHSRGVYESDVLAEHLATLIGCYLGGRDMYIPSGERLNVALRDICIWREFKDNNLEQLCRLYGLSERRVSQIVAEQHTAFVARKQRRLF